ncbi:hypothetical protein GCM10017784_34990 [Deinococcus indicus]|uniref:hypothetical protein n=1 Tax=Deinococcus indicus TaxID=223556 RepID=UPI00174C0558|nr:hypothetical protein [Deinococcus indicus]GHG37589.1 hypothetical protein GCM10017784_34990 [Deinococcus indicus]
MPTDGKRESGALFKHSAAALAVDDGTGRAGMVGINNPLPVALTGDTTGLRVISDEPLIVGTSPVSLTIPAEATYVVVEAQDGTIRFRLDGVAPTATAGHRLVEGEGVQLTRAEAQGFRAVREGSVNVSVMATAYGVPAVAE